MKEFEESLERAIDISRTIKMDVFIAFHKDGFFWVAGIKPANLENSRTVLIVPPNCED